MICEIIKKPGEKGSGGCRDAFAPGVRYVCSKATRVELRNITSPDWRHAAEEMRLTSELSPRVQKPFYHIVLSWHEHEQPTDAQMLAAMDHLLRALGLEEHHVVIGTHGDTPRRHVHAVVNTVHPTTGKVWSKSQDHRRAELACRQIELDQGWTRDRGRFDVEVLEQDGHWIARLRPAPEVWAKREQDRAIGRRKPSPGDVAFRKKHGVDSFSQDIPPALKESFARIVGGAATWGALHEGLARIGLQYRKAGSGARIRLAGSSEYTKASAFGSAFSITRLEKTLGPYRDPVKDHSNNLLGDPEDVASATGVMTPEDRKNVRTASFKLTLLRRIYTGLHLDETVAREIRRVDLDTIPPRITFRDNNAIMDHGAKISASAVTETTVKATVAMALAKGWRVIVPSGPAEYVRGIAFEAARMGLPISGVPEEVQVLAGALLEQTRKRQQRRARAADTIRKRPLDTGADQSGPQDTRESAIAREAAEAVFGYNEKATATPAPAADTSRPARDAARLAQPGPARGYQYRPEADWSEIEDMKRIDIGIIAQLGGWSDVSRIHPDSTDPHGKAFRIFRKDQHTAKASLVGGRWLWTSNKSGAGGSVIDLWLHDNPGKTLGDARKLFRDLLGRTAPAPMASPPLPSAPVTTDHTEARQRWEAAPPIGTLRSYAEVRGISRHTLLRFPDQVRAGAFGGIYFAHRNPDTGDIQGFEQRWEQDRRKNRTRFAKGGLKTVNVLGDPETATRVVVLEGGLDALALAEIEARNDTLYVSTGGGFGARTEAALLHLAQERRIVSAFDNDPAGEVLDQKLRAILPVFGRLRPPAHVDGAARTCKDWLDVLVARKSPQHLQDMPGSINRLEMGR